MGDIPLNANFVREENHPLARRRCILWHFNRCMLTGETNCNSNLQQCSLNTENNIDICATTDPHCSAVSLYSAIAELLVRFNYDTHAKFEVAQPFHWRVIASLLLHPSPSPKNMDSSPTRVHCRTRILRPYDHSAERGTPVHTYTQF